MDKIKEFVKKNKFLILGIFAVFIIIIIAFNTRDRETYTEYYEKKYSKGKEVVYSIQYYKLVDNNWEKEDVITKTGKAGEVIEKYNPVYPEGNWKTHKILNLPLTLSEDEEQNIIKVYYGEEQKYSSFLCVLWKIFIL